MLSSMATEQGTTVSDKTQHMAIQCDSTCIQGILENPSQLLGESMGLTIGRSIFIQSTGVCTLHLLY